MKEVIRLMMNDTPFRIVSKSLFKRLVEVATRNINRFPVEGRSSEILSPTSIATRAPIIDVRKCPADFGPCTEMIEDNGWSHNSNRPKARPVLAL